MILLWQQLMQRLGLSENSEIYDRLIQAFTESHRYYHTLRHIEVMLREFQKVRDLAQRPEEIELAVWFHDAIYKPFSSSNEKDSADWCQSFLQDQSYDPKGIERVYQLILSTEHSAAPTDSDQQLLVDIDLGILGAPELIYQSFETNVRKEYRWVPWFLYRKKRKELLVSFLQRERIYNTQHFYELLEQQARNNLNWAIQRL